LRRLLIDHPQASLDIEFTLYVDPVTEADGQIINRHSLYFAILVNTNFSLDNMPPGMDI